MMLKIGITVLPGRYPGTGPQKQQCFAQGSNELLKVTYDLSLLWTANSDTASPREAASWVPEHLLWLSLKQSGLCLFDRVGSIPYKRAVSLSERCLCHPTLNLHPATALTTGKAPSALWMQDPSLQLLLCLHPSIPALASDSAPPGLREPSTAREESRAHASTTHSQSPLAAAALEAGKIIASSFWK